MSIIRITKQKNFSIISNIPLNDTTISFKAKGIWAYLMSKPDDWQVYVSQLVKAGIDGKSAIYSGIKELIKAGYMEKTVIRKNGKISHYEYSVNEEPIKKTPTENRKGNNVKTGISNDDHTEKLFTENLNTENLNTENRTLLNTDRIPSTDLKKKRTTAPPPPPPDPKPSETKKVKEPSSSYSDHDLNNLMQCVPADKRSPAIEQRLIKAMIAGYTLAYLLDCIAYTNDKAKTDYLAYLGNCIDKDYAPTGYHQQQQKQQQEATQARLKAIKEKQVQSDRDKAKQAEMANKHAMVDNLKTDDPDKYQEIYQQACSNIGLDPQRPGRGSALKIKFEIFKILKL